MIELLSVVYQNYDLAELQVAHWRRLAQPGSYRIRFVDNTPYGPAYQPDRLQALVSETVSVDRLTVGGIDGESHGAALDFLVAQAESAIVGLFDTDCFFLMPGILEAITAQFAKGVECVGCAGFYPDWQQYLDVRWPERAGYLAPVCWGMFVDRQLASEQTFVCTAAEARDVHETGWRLRERLIREFRNRAVWGGRSDPRDMEICWFSNPPYAVHLLKGSAGRMGLTGQIPALIEEGMAAWK